MSRYTVISSDCHAGPPQHVYKDYLEKQHLDAFEEYLSGSHEYIEGTEEGPTEHVRAGFGDEVLSEVDHQTDAGGGWYRDPDRRLTELEQDGIVAEILFPALEDVGTEGFPPFLFLGRLASPELQLAGARAWNRWLADFCSKHPDRQGAIGLITAHDMDAAVTDLRWCKDQGFRGALLTGEGEDLPPWNHPQYEPIWTACEELELPFHVHVGIQTNGALNGLRDTIPYLDGTAGDAVGMMWVRYRSHEPLWTLMYAGVFERHPNLKFVMTEQGAAWIPHILATLDSKDEGPRALPRPATEYWQRQCFVGASVMPRLEAEMRYFIGVDQIVWGADYPHYEGSWPNTKKELAETFHGVPPAEISKMLGENAALLYSFDLDQLATVAASVGPTVDEIG
jgi:predicted TIM-barrel fold metal-dependent hydrolase